MGLARSLVSVRKALQERALTMAGASKRLRDSVEGDRWQGLAKLEGKVERLLEDWGCRSRSEVVRNPGHGLAELFPGIDRIVLAAVADLPEAVAGLLAESGLPVEVLVAAPDSRAHEFDGWGRPGVDWAEQEIPWPESGSVRVVADPREQAGEALRVLAEEGRSSDEVALGSADEETAEELERMGERVGWPVFHPGKQGKSPWVAWLGGWRAFLARPGVAEAMDLLCFSETGILVRGRRAQRSRALSRARDQYMVRGRADLVRVGEGLRREIAGMKTAGEDERALRREKALEDLELARETMEMLEERRASFLREGFHEGMGRLVPVLDPDHEFGVGEWLDDTRVAAEKVSRDPGFWVDLILASAQAVGRVLPDERVLDVVGWLELLYEPGGHLVICGMNEGLVPAQESSDPWLPEGVRRILGLSTAESRAARDAYLLTAMMKMREAGGRVDLLLARASGSGDVLQASRLLLAASGSELAKRVRDLFREIEPPESGLAWTLDKGFRWRRTGEETLVERMSVTAFSSYLACPFRFHLKHVKGLQLPEPERVEWNARDFGNVAHLVLERWGRDPDARDFSKTEALEEWVHRELDRVAAEFFGDDWPLAVRIQVEALRQRLSWFARVQACERAEGWRVVEVEKRFRLELDGVEVRGQVDRIERHPDGRQRVLDYKTSAEAKKVESAHLRRVNAGTRWPEHLEGVEEVLTPDGKARWTNLQVPIYAAALGDVDEIGYFALGATEADVKVSLWDGFGEAEEASALDCARWVVGQVREGRFWPPAARVDFDDYEVLALGRGLAEAFPDGGGVPA